MNKHPFEKISNWIYRNGYHCLLNKTGLQPVSRPVEQVQCFRKKIKRRKLGQIE